MTTALRLALFIDAQNAYRRAKAALFPNSQDRTDGQFSPIDLGHLIASKGGPGGAPCSLSDVRIYSGRPDGSRERRSYIAHRRQTGRWMSAGATVITRPLRYPPAWPNEPAEEKGIDVALAIDVVRLAIGGAYDVGVIMSTDSDLQPAVEFVRGHNPGQLHVAVAAWGITGQDQRLWLPNAFVYCHWLGQNDYNAVADRTKY